MAIFPTYRAEATAGHSSNAIESPTIKIRVVGASSAGTVVGTAVVGTVVLAAIGSGATDDEVVEGGTVEGGTAATVVEANWSSENVAGAVSGRGTSTQNAATPTVTL